MDLFKKQEVLQKEARQVLIDTGIEKLLSTHGNTHITGSLKTGLMVRRDIDVMVTPLPQDNNFWGMAKEFFSIEHVNQLSLVNNITLENKRLPKGLYFGIKYGSEGIVWKIDVWFVDKFTEDYDRWLMENLTD